MKTLIKNFTGAQAVEVGVHRCDVGDTVLIHQDGGSMHFQLNMLPTDARLMAAALIAAADDITSNDMLDSDEFAEIGRLMDKDND